MSRSTARAATAIPMIWTVVMESGSRVVRAWPHTSSRSPPSFPARRRMAGCSTPDLIAATLAELGEPALSRAPGVRGAHARARHRLRRRDDPAAGPAAGAGRAALAACPSPRWRRAPRRGARRARRSSRRPTAIRSRPSSCWSPDAPPSASRPRSAAPWAARSAPPGGWGCAGTSRPRRSSTRSCTSPALLRDDGGRRVTNVVFMGMGEPFHTYDETLRACRLLNDPDGFGLAARHISVSTVGVVPGIDRFAAEPLQLNLAVSLHAATDDLRDRLVPLNRTLSAGRGVRRVRPVRRRPRGASCSSSTWCCAGSTTRRRR